VFSAVRKNIILVVFGTRPEAIKLAPVVRALDAHSSMVPIVCVTGQHRALLDRVLDTFQIRPDFDLDLMRPGQTLGDLAARILQGVQQVIRNVTPDFVLVQGDTSTSFAASLASFYERVPIGHVEAGLRTWNIAAPFPEEAHRAMVSRLATLHFAPNEQAARNLVREGTPSASVYVTGNTVIDSLRIARDALPRLSAQKLKPVLGARLSERLSDPSAPIVLITGHRRENLGGRLDTVVRVIRDLAAAHPDWCFVYLLHPNPDSRLPANALLGALDNVFLLEPLDYIPFVWLMARSTLLLTDSGGLQEEATELGKPLLIMRDVTERPEAVEQGGARLVGTNGARILDAAEEAMRASPEGPTGQAHHLYGDGNAANRIVDILWSTIRQNQSHLASAASSVSTPRTKPSRRPRVPAAAGFGGRTRPVSPEAQ
jgi:UDP-N-acetylglucosamine 2-epimerase (non-hydrolysing)